MESDSKMDKYRVFWVIGIIQILIVSELDINSSTRIGETVLFVLLMFPFQFYMYMNSIDEESDVNKRNMYRLLLIFVSIISVVCVILILKGDISR